MSVCTLREGGNPCLCPDCLPNIEEAYLEALAEVKKWREDREHFAKIVGNGDIHTAIDNYQELEVQLSTLLSQNLQLTEENKRLKRMAEDAKEAFIVFTDEQDNPLRVEVDPEHVDKLDVLFEALSHPSPQTYGEDILKLAGAAVRWVEMPVCECDRDNCGCDGYLVSDIFAAVESLPSELKTILKGRE